jgi:hypothetical protein
VPIEVSSAEKEAKALAEYCCCLLRYLLLLLLLLQLMNLAALELLLSLPRVDMLAQLLVKVEVGDSKDTRHRPPHLCSFISIQDPSPADAATTTAVKGSAPPPLYKESPRST